MHLTTGPQGWKPVSASISHRCSRWATRRPYRAYPQRREWYDCPNAAIIVTAIEDIIAAAQASLCHNNLLLLPRRQVTPHPAARPASMAACLPLDFVQYLYVDDNSLRGSVLAACCLDCPDPQPLMSPGLRLPGGPVPHSGSSDGQPAATLPS